MSHNSHAGPTQNQNFWMDLGVANYSNFDNMDCETELNQEQLNIFKNAQQNTAKAYSPPFNNLQFPNDTNPQFQNSGNEYSSQLNMNFPNHGSLSDELSTSQNNFGAVISPGTSSTSGSENDPFLANGQHGFQATKPHQVPTRASVPRAKSKRQILDEEDAILIARDDNDLTEQELQLKKKAQNRAAQRAFRERKETKLKELEAKLLESEIERQKLAEQLDSIRKKNISMENEIFLNKNDSKGVGRVSANEFSFPKTEDDFIQGLVAGTDHQLNNNTIYKVYDSPDHPGNKILAIGAVWDYLQIKVEELDLDYTSVNIPEIMLKLKGHEKCHGFGPAYPLDLVDSVISECLQEQDY